MASASPGDPSSLPPAAEPRGLIYKVSTQQGKTPTPVVVHVDQPIKDHVGSIESAHEVGDHIIFGKTQIRHRYSCKVSSFLSEKLQEF